MAFNVVIQKDSKRVTVWRFHCRRSTFPSVILRPECCTDQGLNPGSPAQPTGAYPTELIGRWFGLKLVPFTVTSCLLVVFLFLHFSLYSRFGFNPLSPKSDQHQISLCNINAL